MQTVKNSLVVIGILLCAIGAGLVMGTILDFMSSQDALNIFFKFVLLGAIAAVFVFLVSLLRNTGKK